MSQKTFANHLADEEAAIAAQAPQSLAMPPPRTPAQGSSKTAPESRRLSSTIAEPARRSTISAAPTIEDPEGDEPLLKTYIPSAPSPEVIEALLAGPPLSYNAARALPDTGKPRRYFCEICGYWGTIKCLKCGARVCGLECKTTHDEGRCIKFYA